MRYLFDCSVCFCFGIEEELPFLFLKDSRSAYVNKSKLTESLLYKANMKINQTLQRIIEVTGTRYQTI